MTRAHGLTRYKHGPDEAGTPGKGCRCAVCRDANASWQARRSRLIAYGQWEGWADATGTQRRLQALVRNGWSIASLATRLGVAKQVLRVKLLKRCRVTAATERAVRALYDELWDQAPPEGTRREREVATKARRYAQEKGWVPPLAYDEDEIDNPDAKPVPGWERQSGVRPWGVLAEEAADLLRFGVEPEQAAERLGVSMNTLGTTLARARKREAATREEAA